MPEGQFVLMYNENIGGMNVGFRYSSQPNMISDDLACLYMEELLLKRNEYQ